VSLEQVLPPDHSLVFAKPGTMSDAKRQLKIKTGSVRRLAKEVVMYKKDEQTETDRVSRMKAAGGDPSDIKHAVRTMQLHSWLCVHHIWFRGWAAYCRNKFWQRQL